MRKGRGAGSKLLTPAQVDELRKEAFTAGRIAAKKETDGRTERLEERLRAIERETPQRELALNILRDSVITLQAICMQSIDILRDKENA